MYAHWAYMHRSMPHVMKVMMEETQVEGLNHLKKIKSTAWATIARMAHTRACERKKHMPVYVSD